MKALFLAPMNILKFMLLRYNQNMGLLFIRLVPGGKHITTDRRLSIVTHRDDTPEQLKQSLEMVTGVPNFLQRLMYYGVSVTGGNRLKDYDFKHELQLIESSDVDPSPNVPIPGVCTFDWVPQEILVVILQHVDATTSYTPCRKVCSAWRSVWYKYMLPKYYENAYMHMVTKVKQLATGHSLVEKKGKIDVQYVARVLRSCVEINQPKLENQSNKSAKKERNKVRGAVEGEVRSLFGKNLTMFHCSKELWFPARGASIEKDCITSYCKSKTHKVNLDTLKYCYRAIVCCGEEDDPHHMFQDNMRPLLGLAVECGFADSIFQIDVDCTHSTHTKFIFKVESEEKTLTLPAINFTSYSLPYGNTYKYMKYILEIYPKIVYEWMNLHKHEWPNMRILPVYEATGSKLNFDVTREYLKNEQGSLTSDETRFKLMEDLILRRKYISSDFFRYMDLLLDGYNGDTTELLVNLVIGRSNSCKDDITFTLKEIFGRIVKKGIQNNTAADMKVFFKKLFKHTYEKLIPHYKMEADKVVKPLLECELAIHPDFKIYKVSFMLRLDMFMMAYNILQHKMPRLKSKTVLCGRIVEVYPDPYTVSHRLEPLEQNFTEWDKYFFDSEYVPLCHWLTQVNIKNWPDIKSLDVKKIPDYLQNMYADFLKKMQLLEVLGPMEVENKDMNYIIVK